MQLYSFKKAATSLALSKARFLTRYSILIPVMMKARESFYKHITRSLSIKTSIREPVMLGASLYSLKNLA